MSSLMSIADLFDFKKGKKPGDLFDTCPDEGKPFLQIDHLRNQGKKIFTVDKRATEVNTSDICIVWDGANAGLVGYGLEGYIGSTITRLRPKEIERVHVPYVAKYLQSKFSYINKSAQGAAIPHVDGYKLKNLALFLPSMPEQKRIAAILDKADAVRRKRQQTIELCEQLLLSVFLNMFGDPISNPKGYKLGKIGDLLLSANYGTSSKAGENGQFPILRMNNITYAGNWDLGSLKYIDMDENERKKYTAEPGDILFNRTNSKELVGKTAVFREKEPYIFAGYLIRSKTNSLAEPEYISGFLNSTYGKKVLRNMCKSIVGMANINAKEYQSIEILIPPIEEQQKYAKITKKTRLNISCYQESLNKFDELFNSLSQKAFRGELSRLSETTLA